MRVEHTLGLVPLVIAASFLLGCGGTKSESSLEDLTRQGTLDASLAPSQSAKQRAVFDVLATLQEGASPELVHRHVRGVVFRESSQAFLEGALRLSRWKFAGPPAGDSVPVVLWLATVDAARDSDQGLRKVERVYQVTGSPGHMVIARK